MPAVPGSQVFEEDQRVSDVEGIVAEGSGFGWWDQAVPASARS
ncbi:MAG: hypothetical protein ACE3L7_26185 [Candidatus Pristimantibacillus sp.]